MKQIILTPHLYNHVEIKNQFTILVYDSQEFNLNERIEICMAYTGYNGLIVSRFTAIVEVVEPSIPLTTDLEVRRITCKRADPL